MAVSTKQEEREALEQIRKIVEALGPDSYVGTAFMGCFEDAEENIENDFAFSMYGRYKSIESEYEDLYKENRELVEKMSKLESEIKSQSETVDQLRSSSVEDSNTITRQRDAYVELKNTYDSTYAEQTARIKELEQEVIVLKAKLYDLIVKE